MVLMGIGPRAGKTQPYYLLKMFEKSGGLGNGQSSNWHGEFSSDTCAWTRRKGLTQRRNDAKTRRMKLDILVLNRP
jgi:hypothetical protein